MNVRHLQYFVKIAEVGSLRRASEELYVTQSALSRAITELEKELECQLLTRSRQGVKATSHGIVFMDRAQQILADIDTLKSDLHEEHRQIGGHVRLAMPVGVRDRLTRPLVKRLRNEHPNMRIDVINGNAHENRAAVLDGIADVAVIQELDRGLLLNYQRLYVDALCLIGPPDAGFKLNEPLDLTALDRSPLLLIRAPSQVRWTVDAAMRKIKAEVQPAMEVSSSHLLLDLVKDGHGFAILPQSQVTDSVNAGLISGAPLEDLQMTWIAAWLRSKTMSPAVRTTIDTLIAIV